MIRHQWPTGRSPYSERDDGWAGGKVSCINFRVQAARTPARAARTYEQDPDATLDARTGDRWPYDPGPATGPGSPSPRPVEVGDHLVAAGVFRVIEVAVGFGEQRALAGLVRVEVLGAGGADAHRDR